MTERNIANEVKNIVVELLPEIPQEVIEEKSGLQADFGLDSLGFAELRAQCERQFDVAIPNAEFSGVNFCSIDCLANLITKLLPTTEG